MDAQQFFPEVFTSSRSMFCDYLNHSISQVEVIHRSGVQFQQKTYLDQTDIGPDPFYFWDFEDEFIGGLYVWKV